MTYRLLLVLALATACDDRTAARPPDDANVPPDAGDDAGDPNDGSASDAGSVAARDAGVDAALEPSVDLVFRGHVGSALAACGTVYEGFGPARDQRVELRDFRLYLHGVEVIRPDGSVEPLVVVDESPWQRNGIALVDFEDRTGGCSNGTAGTRTVVRVRAFDGPIATLRFVLGVPSTSNHVDRSTASAPLNLSPLFWNWQGGYVFHRLDLGTVAGDDGGVVAGFSVHLGSTGCDGDPVAGGTTACANPNRPTIELDGFDPREDAIVLDAARLVEGVDLTVNTPGTAVGCMASPLDPECDAIMPRFGLDFGATPGAQTYVSTEPL